MIPKIQFEVYYIYCKAKRSMYWLESLGIMICVWDYISYCISLSPPNYFEAVLANNSTRAIFIQYVSVNFVRCGIAYHMV